MRMRRRWLRTLARVLPTARNSGRAAEHTWDSFLDWFDGLKLSENAILIAFAVAVGALGALGVILFYKLIDLAYSLFFRIPADYVPRYAFLGYRPVLTGAGFLLAYFIIRRFARGHRGPTVPDVQLAVARSGGEIPARPTLARTAASAVTLGCGGSAGSEGPVAVLGAAAASALSRLFRFAPGRVQVLVGAGAAAGISAAFNAPLAGAFFALEEILGSFAVGAFAPVVVASVVAAVISRGVFGNHPALEIPQEYGYALSSEIFVLFPLLGVICGLTAVLFIRSYFKAEDLATRWQQRPVLRAALGGIAVGLLVFASQGLLVGYGHLAIRIDVFGRMAWYALALLALGKIAATAITLNFGGSGGLFTPSLYIGAATGGAFGVGVSALFPGLHLSPEAYALVGMGAVVAAATAAPITGILIVFEMTNDYAIMLPLMLVVAISMVVTKRLEPDSLYSGWLRRRGDHIEHGADRDVLAGIQVQDVYERVESLTTSASLEEMLEYLGRGAHTDLPIVADNGRFVGVVTVADLGRLAAQQQELAPLVIAADVAVPTRTTTPSESVLDAIRKMGARGTAALPVIEPDTGVLLGVVTRAHVLAAYERRIATSPRPA